MHEQQLLLHLQSCFSYRGKCFGFWGVFCPYEPPYIVAVLLFLTFTHFFPTVFYLFQVKGIIFREKKVHRLNRTNDDESQPSNGFRIQKHVPESKTLPRIQKHVPESKILGSVLDSGTCFWILGSVLDSGKCFWILGRVFGFWEVFWILGRVFGLWEVF